MYGYARLKMRPRHCGGRCWIGLLVRSHDKDRQIGGMIAANS
jgi:hypothetical protein